MRIVAWLWRASPSPLRPIFKRVYYSRWFPGHWWSAARLIHILLFKYGYLDSVARKAPVDASGAPVPWYTYPAIEYLKQMDFSRAAVFEFGSGFSTLFWCARAQRVVTVEENAAWFERMRTQVPPNCQLSLESDLDRYADAIMQTGELFDVIVIDGGDRYKCAQRVGRALRPGGLVILDNSDWAPESSRVLREYGLIEVDMTGFSPGTAFAGSTSLYFHREFNFHAAQDRQPAYGVGARLIDWEKTLTAQRHPIQR